MAIPTTQDIDLAKKIFGVDVLPEFSKNSLHKPWVFGMQVALAT